MKSASRQPINFEVKELRDRLDSWGARRSLRSKVVFVMMRTGVPFRLESQLLEGARDGTRQGPGGRQG